MELLYSLDPVPDYTKTTVQTAIKIHHTEKEGDILCFLTGKCMALHNFLTVFLLDHACWRFVNEYHSMFCHHYIYSIVIVVPVYRFFVALGTKITTTTIKR